MEGLFLSILNMSISASWLILAVIVVRALLGKAPKGFRYALWALVAIRLLCPFSFESTLSLIPSGEAIPEDIVYSETPQINTGVGVLDETLNPIISDNLSPSISGDMSNDIPEADESVNTGGNTGIGEGGNVSVGGTAGETPSIGTQPTPDYNSSTNSSSVNPMQVVMHVATIVWCVGIFGMLIYTVVSYIQLWKKVQISVRVQENVWISDEIQSPFILGIVRPRIYLPSHIEKSQMNYIIAHENEHLRCLDYLWKPLGFVVLTIHWFNPLVWVAYILMCRDIELACDERVIRRMNVSDKKTYSEVLLACSSPRHFISACPVAFGEIGIKERIKKILTYKKPTVWLVGIAVVVCVVIGICFLTNPRNDESVGGTETESESEIGSEDESEKNNDNSEETEENYLTLEFSIDIDHDDIAETVVINGDLTKNYTDFYFEVRRDGNAIFSQSRGAYHPYYYHVTMDGKDYILYYAKYNEPAYTFADFELFYVDVLGNKRIVDSASAEAYYAEIDQMDKASWVEFAQKVNVYFENARLLMGIQDKKIVYSNEENPVSYTENFHWLIDGAVENEKTIEEVLDVFITLTKENYPNPPEKVLYETAADVTHDGIDDLVQTLIYSPYYTFDLEMGADMAYVRVFRGTGEGNYEDEEYYRSYEYSTSHAGNGTVCITEKDGKDYLMHASMYEHQGEAYYEYKVYYIGQDGNEVVLEEDMISFANTPYWPQWDRMPHREDVVPALREKMTPWIANGTILFALDVDEPVFVSTQETVYPANSFFDLIWARSDADEIARFEQEIGGMEDWRVYLYRSDALRYSDWIETLSTSQLSEWYTDYSGEKNHRIAGEVDYGISTNNDVIYYDANEGESVQSVLETMIEAMIVPRMEPSDKRTYTITRYAIEEQPVHQVSEHMWLVEYLNGYYEFEGVDLGTMEDMLEYDSENRPDGLVAFERQGSESMFLYILIEENGVYRLEKCSGMYEKHLDSVVEGETP